MAKGSLVRGLEWVETRMSNYDEMVKFYTKNLGLFLGVVAFFPCAYILARWRTTVAPWPSVTPIPSRLVGGGRVSRFHRLFERMSRLRP